MVWRRDGKGWRGSDRRYEVPEGGSCPEVFLVESLVRCYYLPDGRKECQQFEAGAQIPEDNFFSNRPQIIAPKWHKHFQSGAAERNGRAAARPYRPDQAQSKSIKPNQTDSVAVW